MKISLTHFNFTAAPYFCEFYLFLPHSLFASLFIQLAFLRVSIEPTLLSKTNVITKSKGKSILHEYSQ